jgi:hypothetical protein
MSRGAKRILIVDGDVHHGDGTQKAFDFGQDPPGNTYIDGATDQTRENYMKRHLANKSDRMKIENFIPSPATFSFYILWGETRSIPKNIKILNKLME